MISFVVQLNDDEGSCVMLSNFLQIMCTEVLRKVPCVDVVQLRSRDVSNTLYATEMCSFLGIASRLADIHDVSYCLRATQTLLDVCIRFQSVYTVYQKCAVEFLHQTCKILIDFQTSFTAKKEDYIFYKTTYTSSDSHISQSFQEQYFNYCFQCSY